MKLMNSKPTSQNESGGRQPPRLMILAESGGLKSKFLIGCYESVS